jgi:hypothetical protein
MEQIEITTDTKFSLPEVEDALVTMTSRQDDTTTCPDLQPSCPNTPPNATPVEIQFVQGYQLLEQTLNLPGSYVNPAPFTTKKHFKLL